MASHEWIMWHLESTVLNILLQLVHSLLLLHDIVVRVECDLVICVQLFLQLDDGLISLVESTGQGYHDVSLLEQQLLVSINLSLPLLQLISLLLHLTQFHLVLLPYNLLLFL